MPTDVLGNAVTASDPRALAAIDDFVLGIIAYRTCATNVLALADAGGDAVLVEVYGGFLQLLGEDANGARAAAPFLDRAAALAARGTPRERQLVAVLRHWVNDHIDNAVDALAAIVAENPGDLASLKLLHYHQFNRGDFAGMLRAALGSAEANPAAPYLHGMLAFAYEQLHLIADAERAARRALELVADDPWAYHALAHVALSEGRIDEGTALLEAAAPGWTGLNSFMITHLWWHLALFYVSLGRVEDAFAAYDRHVWAVARDYSQDQIGAVSLLARFEMAGLDVGERWADLAPYLAKRADDVVQPFLTVQYLFGLARAGRPEAAQLFAAIEHAASDGPAHSRAVWREVALPLARGLIAHARGAFDEAADRLTEALPQLIRLGGSHAQRDVFEQFLLDANIRSGRLIQAQQMLESRRRYDPDGVALNRLLGDVYRRLGLPLQAEEARTRVERRLAA